MASDDELDSRRVSLGPALDFPGFSSLRPTRSLTPVLGGTVIISSDTPDKAAHARILAYLDLPEHNNVTVSIQKNQQMLRHLMVRLCSLRTFVLIGLLRKAPFFAQSRQTGGPLWFPPSMTGRGKGNNIARGLFVRPIKDKNYTLASRPDGTIHLRRPQAVQRAALLIGTETREVRSF